MNFRKIRSRIVVIAGILVLTVLPQTAAAECAQIQHAGGTDQIEHTGNRCCNVSVGSGSEIGNDSQEGNDSLTGNIPQCGQQIADLVNRQRSAYGLEALAYDAQLTELAQKKAEDMAENDYFSHQSPVYGSAFDMLQAAGITYRSAGENIARGQSSPEEVMNSWMNSSGHRENILSSSYTSIGVGCATDRSGRICWVQIFKG